MNINIDINKNELHLDYELNEPFDENVLIKHEQLLSKLKPNEAIYITTTGYVPLEVTAYLCEVTKFCEKMIWTIVYDRDTYDFALFIIKDQYDYNIELKFVETPRKEV